MHHKLQETHSQEALPLLLDLTYAEANAYAPRPSRGRD